VAALADFEKAVAVDPGLPEAHLNLALARLGLGRTAEGVSALERSLELAPGQPAALDQLAWVLATSTDPGVRDPQGAVKAAERACELTARQEPGLLATLAVALAAGSPTAQRRRCGRRSSGEVAQRPRLEPTRRQLGGIVGG
jgi:tetratricopeptide (TPR) repeat protein